MNKGLRNILNTINLYIRLINIRNLKNFLFSLKHESLATTIKNVKNTLFNSRKFEYSEIISSDHKGNTAHYHLSHSVYTNSTGIIKLWINSSSEPIFKLNRQSTLLDCTIHEFNSKNKQVLELARKHNNGLSKTYILDFDLSSATDSDLQLDILIENLPATSIPLKMKAFNKGKARNNSDYDLQYLLDQIDHSKSVSQLSLSYSPLVSIIIPVYKVEAELFAQCLNSVTGQSYDNWQLCLNISEEEHPETLAILEGFKLKYSERILISKSSCSIVEAYNNAISMASGDYMCFLDHDDELSQNALLEIAKLLNKYPETRVLYTNEDIIDPFDTHINPIYKSGYNLELLLQYNYINHLLLIKKDVGDDLGWFRDQFPGAQDYDLLLRLADVLKRDEIRHIDKILYHWRQSENSINYNYFAKEYVLESSVAALQDYYRRNNRKGKVKMTDKIGHFNFQELE